MKTLLTSTALTLLATSTAFAATIVGNIDELSDGYDEKKVSVNGVVSWVEDANEFTIADKTGDIEVNLKKDYPSLTDGMYVTVTGEMRDNLLDNAIDNASINFAAMTYDEWAEAYEGEYELKYDRDGLDGVFYETIDWDNDLYDDYYWVKTE